MDDVVAEDRERLFVALYERHYNDILNYARRRLPEADARDVTSETFLVAWRRLDEVAERGLPWLYRTAHLVTKNVSRSALRADRTVGRLAALPEATTVPDPAVGSTECDEVLQAVRHLPARDRELLLLVTWEQLDVASAAQVVGCTAAAAAVRLHRARRRLRGLLDLSREAASPLHPNCSEEVAP